MLKNGFTAGQTAGITRIAPQSIRRYVLQFPEYFSAEARKPNKGRRYNQQDIKTLLAIRNLKTGHHGEAKIKAALQGELSNLPDFDQLDAIKLVEAAQRVIGRANDLVWEAKTKNRQAYSTIDDAKYLTKRFERSLEMREQVPELTRRINELEENLAKLTEALRYHELRKHGLLSIFG
jgi:DNA-binding transcriptional MerR regulator